MSSAVSHPIPRALRAPSADAVIAQFVSNWREPLIGSLAVRFEGDVGRDTIADAVDEAIADAWSGGWEIRNRGNVPAGREFYAFVQQRARDRLIDYVRRLGALAAPVHGVAADVVEEVRDRRAGAEEGWIGREGSSQLREALSVLDEQAQRILMLRHVENYERSRIAALLGLSERQVKRCLERANKRLHDHYLSVEAGETCGDGRLVVRFAFELVAGRDAKQAEAHIGHCAACRRRYERAQAYRRAVAGVIPFPFAGRAAAPAAGLLEHARGFAARLLGHGNHALPRVGAARGGGPFSGAKIAAVCAAGVAATGAVVCATNGLPDPARQGPAPKPAAHSPASPKHLVAATPALPSPSREHAQVVRAAARRAVVTQRREERRAEARAVARQKRATAPAPERSTDEFFSPSATPSGTPTASTTTTNASPPTHPMSTQSPSSPSADEFAAP